MSINISATREEKRAPIGRPLENVLEYANVLFETNLDEIIDFLHSVGKNVVAPQVGQHDLDA